MEALVVIVIAAVAMVGFDLLASARGVDSRPKLADDHRR